MDNTVCESYREHDGVCFRCGNTREAHYDCDEDCKSDGRPATIHSLLPTVTQAAYIVAACQSTELAAQLLAVKYELDEDDAMQMADDAWELLLSMSPEGLSHSQSCSYHVLRVALIEAIDNDSTGLVVSIQSQIDSILGSVQ